MGRKIAWVVSLGLLIFSGVVGTYNGLTEWGEGRNALQHSVTVSVAVYGVFGLLTAYGLVRRRRWSIRTAIVWTIGVTYAPGVAVMAYAGEDAMLASAIAASVGSLLLALGVIWTTNVMTRAHA